MERIDIVGDYYSTKKDLENFLGKGSFGDVFKCYNKKKEGKTFAMKRMIFPESHYVMPYIRSEIEILQALRQDKKVKNAIKLYKYYENKDEQKKNCTFHLIFEYCKGGDLKTLIEKHAPFSEVEIYYILYPIAVCLRDLHKQKIIHRDIKAANILLVDKWKPKDPSKVKVRLTDFGVSSIDKEMFSSVVGTRYEMAPEIFKEQECTSAVDVYAFGLVLYQMLFDTMAFDSISCSTWFQNKAYLKLPKCRFLSVECFDLLQRSVRVNPEHRITFEQMVKHPFFEKKGMGRLFLEMFDGTMDVNYVSMKGPAVDYVELYDKQIAEGKFYKSNHKIEEEIINNNYES